MDDINDDIIRKFFPFKKYREHQRDDIANIVRAFAKGAENVIYEAPVGSGKSAVAATIASMLQGCFYITIQKVLMEQLINDFSDQMTALKGRNAYSCWFMNEYMKSNKWFGADKGRCTQKGKAFNKFCIDGGRCVYRKQLDLAQSTPQTIFNFSSFLFQRHMTNRFTEERPLLIVDECHNIESQIMNFVETVVRGDDIDIEVPEYNSAEAYVDWLKEIDVNEIIASKVTKLDEQLKVYISDDDSELADLSKEDAEQASKIMRDMDKYKSLSGRFASLMQYINKVRCISDFNSQKNMVTIKPLYAHYHTPKLLLSAGSKRLFMSATVLNDKVFGHSIGLDYEKTVFIRTPHTFPVQNRLIHLDYAGPMNYRSRSSTLPKLIKKIDQLMNRHKGERGIIHCQSFWLMESICDGVSHNNSKRLIHQKMFHNKNEMLHHHSLRNESVIIAPAMHEGLDLKDDLSRFQLICKIPYPDARSDKQLQERTKENWNYYLWLTALKLIQSIGRSVRSQTDHASTYILDADFDKFFNMADRVGLLPDWLVESLIID